MVNNSPLPPKIHRPPDIGGIARGLLALLMALLLTTVPPANAACVLAEKTTVGLTMAGGALAVPVEINGIRTSFILDTGAQRSVVSDTAIQRLALARDQWVGTTMSGIGGIDRRPNADPGSFTIGGIPLVRRTLNHDNSLSVGVLPRPTAAGPQIDGLLGRDFLSMFDLDLDVPERRLTLYQPNGCSGRFLPWTGPYDSIPITMPTESAIEIPVVLDGTPLRALLDTGAGTSLIGAPGIFRLRLDLVSLQRDPGDQVGGLGSHTVIMRRHTFRSLQIGRRTIDQPVLWVAPVQLRPIVDMLIGADWLATRRVWISYTSRQLFVATP